MNCHRFENELENRGPLKALETDAAFGEHLKNCPACQAKRAEYARLFEMLASDRPPMPDDAYWASFPALVREHIEKAKARRRWKPVLGWSLPTAALVLVIGIAFFVSREKQNLTNLTAEEAFNYITGTTEKAADLPLPENALTSVAAQAEEEIVGQNNVDDLVLSLTDEQFQKLEIKLKSFKL